MASNSASSGFLVFSLCIGSPVVLNKPTLRGNGFVQVATANAESLGFGTPASVFRNGKCREAQHCITKFAVGCDRWLFSYRHIRPSQRFKGVLPLSSSAEGLLH
jgi:hypothetical protein